MESPTKHEAIRKWLHANPEKTERDWLLEERCTNDWQRDNLKRLFIWADKNNIPILICSEIGSYRDTQTCYQQIVEVIDPEMKEFMDDLFGDILAVHPTIYVESDFQIGKYSYDLDAPEAVFEQSIPDLYLNWKAKQMGINPLLTHTEYEIYEAFKPYMGANIPHWTSLIQE